MHSEPISTLSHLRGLLEVSRRVRDEHDLTRLVDQIAATISESLGFRTVAINLYRPAEGDFRVTTVHGSDAARAALLGQTSAVETWTSLLAERFLRRGAYLIPHGEGDWGGVLSHVPELPLGTDPEAWHPEDALLVPMRGADGELLGVVAVDEPETGLRPGDEEVEILVAFSGHVAAAIEAARETAAATRDRAALSRLLDVSASLVERDSVESVLDAVARGIYEALEFEKVAVCLNSPDGRFVPTGIAGWTPGDPGLDFALTQADLDALLVPEFELEGCYLIENETANAIASDRSNYASRRGGSGPRAWRRHWLLVPLVERDGSRSGFVWVDDPADSMLPSPERLQALRTFANQATVALRAARDFAALNARNRELDALHETTVALLRRTDLDSLLAGIVASACALVGTRDGYLYLVDREADRLRLAVGAGYFDELRAPLIARGEGLSGRVWASGTSLRVDDYASWSARIEAFQPRLHASVGVPLIAHDEVVGVLGLVHEAPNARFGAAEVALLERFAQLASLALENARLYAALQHSETVHRGIVEASTDVICLVGFDGRIEMISGSSVAVLGRTPDELVGMPFLALVHPDDRDVAIASFGRALTEPTSLTVRALRADGETVTLEATSTPIVDARGGPERLLATVRDVTERRLLEDKLRQAQKMEAIGRLAGGIAHDFNNLLTAIGGYSELGLTDLEAGSADAVAESLAQISRASNRAAELTAQLLAFSRKQVLHLRELDLNGIVSDLASMLARMLGEDIVLTAHLDPELGTVMADPGQVEQVVLNLAINARDAMPTGGNLSIRTRNFELRPGEPAPAPELLPGRYVLLEVEDDGVGMVLTLTERVFEPFFTTKDVGEGTGLGLATVHGIVSQSGGAVWVDSTPGEGTTFSVCLPRT